jgi:hypothetical protein
MAPHWKIYIFRYERDAALAFGTYFEPEGLGANDHIPSPIKQTGPSRSQIPSPSLFPEGSAAGVPERVVFALVCIDVENWSIIEAPPVTPGKTGFVFPAICVGNGVAVGEVAGCQAELIALEMVVDTGAPRAVELDADAGTFGNFTTPIAGKSKAKQLLAQIRMSPENFIMGSPENRVEGNDLHFWPKSSRIYLPKSTGSSLENMAVCCPFLHGFLLFDTCQTILLSVPSSTDLQSSFYSRLLVSV